MKTKEKKRLRLKAPERRTISTEATYDIKKAKKRALIIKQSKEKKLRKEAQHQEHEESWCCKYSCCCTVLQVNLNLSSNHSIWYYVSLSRECWVRIQSTQLSIHPNASLMAMESDPTSRSCNSVLSSGSDVLNSAGMTTNESDTSVCWRWIESNEARWMKYFVNISLSTALSQLSFNPVDVR